MDKKDLERLKVMGNLKYPQNAFSQEIKKMLESIDVESLKEVLPLRDYEEIKDYLVKEIVLPFPDFNGGAFTTNRLAKVIDKLGEYFRKRMKEDVEFANKLFSLLAQYRIRPELANKIQQYAVWRVLTLYFTSAKTFTPIFVLLSLVFFIDKGILGKVTNKEVVMKWKDYWKKYGNYLLTGKFDGNDFEKLYEELKPYFEEAYEKMLKSELSKTT